VRLGHDVEEAGAVLRAALSDPSAAMRAAALEGLAEAGAAARPAAPELRRALADRTVGAGRWLAGPAAAPIGAPGVPGAPAGPEAPLLRRDLRTQSAGALLLLGRATERAARMLVACLDFQSERAAPRVGTLPIAELAHRETVRRLVDNAYWPEVLEAVAAG